MSIVKIDDHLYKKLQEEVDLSRLDMTENEILEEIKDCLKHSYNFDEIVETFRMLEQSHNLDYDDDDYYDEDYYRYLDRFED